MKSVEDAYKVTDMTIGLMTIKFELGIGAGGNRGRKVVKNFFDRHKPKNVSAVLKLLIRLWSNPTTVKRRTLDVKFSLFSFETFYECQYFPFYSVALWLALNMRTLSLWIDWLANPLFLNPRAECKSMKQLQTLGSIFQVGWKIPAKIYDPPAWRQHSFTKEKFRLETRTQMLRRRANY